MSGIYCFHFPRLTQWSDGAVWKVTRQYLTPNSQECTDCQNHYQQMISGPIVTVTGPTGEQFILISSFHFLMEELGPSVHSLFVSSVPQCVSSPACRKTFSFTAISATLSQLTPREKQNQQYLQRES